MSGLPEDWEFLQLNDIAELTSSKRIYLSDYVESGIPFYRGKEITLLKKNEKVEDILYISEDKYNEIKTKYGIPQKNDILITAVGTLANTYRVPNDSKFYFKDGNLIWLKNISENSIFLEYSLNYNKTILLDSAIGSSQKALTIVELKKLKIPFPPLNEQKKIANILSTVDEKIALIDNQIEETETLKKGLMQKLLTEGIGHSEFKDSEIGRIPVGWGVVAFNNCAKITVGIATSTTKHFTDSGTPLIRNQNIKENKFDLKELLFISEKFNSMNEKKNIKAGDILIVRTGYPGLSAVVTAEMEGWQTFTTLIARPNLSILNPNFVAYYMNSIVGKKFLTKLEAGGAQKNLNVKAINNFKVPIPPLKEQTQIAKILSTTDEKLEILRDKKKSFEKLKKGLMQKLLTGEVRVKV